MRIFGLYLLVWKLVLTAIFVSDLKAADISFRRATIDSNNPPNPHCKTIGDINGDGFIDVLAASSSGGGLFWYRYPNWDKYPIANGAFTTDMQTGDIDNDGDLDAIIPDGSGLKWFKNPRPGGDPTRDAWEMILIGASGSQNHDVEVGDINRDGRLDVVSRQKTGGGTYVWIQNSPTSWTKLKVSSDEGEGISLGDIDGDGDLDVAHGRVWLENPGHTQNVHWPAWTIDTNWPPLLGTLVVDLNGDGRKDIVLAPSESSDFRFAWYESTNPKGGAWTAHVIDSSVSYFHTFKAGDIDRDGDLDLVTAEMHQSSGPDEVSVYRNNGGALSWSKQVVATTGSHNIRLADIGNDGDLDIVGANWDEIAPNSALIEMWENLSEGGRSSGSLDSWNLHLVDGAMPWTPLVLSAADIDRDGKLDIVAGGWWYKNSGRLDTGWERRAIGGSLKNMAWIEDFDGDGDLDVFGTDGTPQGGSLSWAQNNGSGTFTILTNVPFGQNTFFQGAIGGVFSPGAPYRMVMQWEDGESGASPVEEFAKPANPTSATWTKKVLHSKSQGEKLTKADLDNDGDLDLFQGPSWLRNDGAAGWTYFQVATFPQGQGTPDRHCLVDVDNDGDLDAIVGLSHFTGPDVPVYWLEHPVDPTQSWPRHILADAGISGGHSLDAKDMDGDGDVDVVVGEHRGARRAFVYENVNNGQTWVQHVLDPGATGRDHHNGTLLYDMDGDGDLDVISMGWDNWKVWVFENLSNQGPPPPSPLPPSPPPSGVPTADLALWLRADAGVITSGSSVSQWQDQSGNAVHASQSIVASRPLLLANALNGRPALQFDGTNDFLTFVLSLNGQSGVSLCLVSANTADQSGGSSEAENAALFWNEMQSWGACYLSPFQRRVQFRFGTTQVGNSPTYTGPASLGSGYSVNIAVKNGTTDTLCVNGTQVAQENGKNSSISGSQTNGNLGRGLNNTYFSGRVAEVLVYRRALNASERQSLESYIQTKYFNAPSPPQSVTTPTISPNGGSFDGPVTVALQSSTTGASIRYTLNGTSPEAGSTLYTGPVQLSNSVTVRARAFKSGMTDSAEASAVFTINPPPPPPSEVPTDGLAMWLRADAGVILSDARVSQWQDQSGHDVHASQSASGSRPTLIDGAINGRPALQFDGADDFLNFTLALNGLNGLTLCLIGANTTDRSGGSSEAESAALFWNETQAWGSAYLSPFQSRVQFRFGTTQAGNLPTYVRPTSLGAGYSLSIAIKNGTNDALYVNGALAWQESGKLNSLAACQTTGNLGRGFNNNSYFPGRIAEVLVYQRALSTSERQSLESYIQTKYFSPPPPVSEVPTAGLAMWLRADDGVIPSGTRVSQWQDRSGNNVHASQSASGSQPTVIAGAINGRPALQFDGADDFLNFTLALNGLNGLTLCLIGANTTDRNGGSTEAESAALFWNETQAWGSAYLSPFQSRVQFRFGTTQAGNLPTYVRPTSLGAGYSLSIAIKNGTNDALYVNGALAWQESGKLNSLAACQTTGNLGRGFNNNSYFPGRIAEVLVYRRALSQAEREDVENYVANRYFGASAATLRNGASPLRVERQPHGGYRAVGRGEPGRSYQILQSLDLIRWERISAQAASAEGHIEFSIPHAPDILQQYFRLSP